MEKSKKIDTTKRPEEKRDIGGTSCPIWIFGNEESADNDLKNKFEVVDEENKG